MSTDTEWVVAVPEKRNYLAHLAPISGESSWATRSVKALCGWAGFAKGTVPDMLLERGEYVDKYRRRCRRCERKAAAK